MTQRSAIPFITAGLLCAAVPRIDAASFYAITPCRLFNTQDTTSPTGGAPLANGGAYSFAIQGKCGVPVAAKAAFLNVTVVAPTGDGNLILYPRGTPIPSSSTINFKAGTFAIANGALAPLSAPDPATGQDLTIYAVVVGTGSQVHLILDVTGYIQ